LSNSKFTDIADNLLVRILSVFCRRVGPFSQYNNGLWVTLRQARCM